MGQWMVLEVGFSSVEKEKPMACPRKLVGKSQICQQKDTLKVQKTEVLGRNINCKD